NQNFPNPFNPVTTIKYDLEVTSFIKLKIYDITGKYIKELVNQKQQSGNYEVKFDGSDLSSGVYFYKLTLETVSGGKEFSETKRMILLK
ncbi:MAG: T9SS type A sorting domain-containing protein, partial [Ignavibacteria bacterium]